MSLTLTGALYLCPTTLHPGSPYRWIYAGPIGQGCRSVTILRLLRTLNHVHMVVCCTGPAGKNTICGGQCISQQEQVCCNMADGEDNNNYVPCAVGDICVVDYDTIGGFTCCAHAAVAPSLS